MRAYAGYVGGVRFGMVDKVGGKATTVNHIRQFDAVQRRHPVVRRGQGASCWTVMSLVQSTSVPAVRLCHPILYCGGITGA